MKGIEKMNVKNRIVHIFMHSPERAAEVKMELTGLDDEASVIVHDMDTFRIAGLSYETVVLEYDPGSSVWLQALAETMACSPPLPDCPAGPRAAGTRPRAQDLPPGQSVYFRRREADRRTGR